MNRKSLVFVSIYLCFLSVGCLRDARRDNRDKQALFSLQKLNCSGCGDRVVRVVRAHSGVSSVAFDKNKVELTVRWNPGKTSKKNLMATIRKMGFVALSGPGKGAYNPPVQFLPGMDVRTISKAGEAVEIERFLVPGKVTVFDFGASWCGPCKDVAQELFKILKKHPGVALRKLNVVDWSSPLAKKYMRKVQQLPYLVVYNQEGKRVRSISGRKLLLLRRTILSLLGKQP